MVVLQEEAFVVRLDDSPDSQKVVDIDPEVA